MFLLLGFIPGRVVLSGVAPSRPAATATSAAWFWRFLSRFSRVIRGRRAFRLLLFGLFLRGCGSGWNFLLRFRSRLGCAGGAARATPSAAASGPRGARRALVGGGVGGGFPWLGPRRWPFGPGFRSGRRFGGGRRVRFVRERGIVAAGAPTLGLCRGLRGRFGCAFLCGAIVVLRGCLLSVFIRFFHYCCCELGPFGPFGWA